MHIHYIHTSCQINVLFSILQKCRYFLRLIFIDIQLSSALLKYRTVDITHTLHYVTLRYTTLRYTSSIHFVDKTCLPSSVSSLLVGWCYVLFNVVNLYVNVMVMVTWHTNDDNMVYLPTGSKKMGQNSW